MKWIDDTRTLELTAGNVAGLTAKLDDPMSARTLASGCGCIMARAVEDDDRTAEPASAAAGEHVVTLTRSELAELAIESATVTVGRITVVAVPDTAHYGDRAPGVMYMPSGGEWR